MTATARSLAPVHQEIKTRRNAREVSRNASGIRQHSPASQIPEFDEHSVLLPDISVRDGATMITVMVPLEGIDIRQVFIFATPGAILVETLSKCMLNHPGPIDSELQRHRITRELRFQFGIVKGSTEARLSGGSLEITSIKAVARGDEAWSELIQIDTRLSRGACDPPNSMTPSVVMPSL